MSKTGTLLDVYALDVLTDEGYTLESLAGLKVITNIGPGLVGEVVPLQPKVEKPDLAVRIKIRCGAPCGKHCRTLYLTSGVHRGAFCIVRDRSGAFLADLRDQDVAFPCGGRR